MPSHCNAVAILMSLWFLFLTPSTKYDQQKQKTAEENFQDKEIKEGRVGSWDVLKDVVEKNWVHTPGKEA